MKVQKIILIATNIVLLIILIFSVRQCSNNKNSKENYISTIEAINSELITYKGKDSLNYAKIQVIQMEKEKDFLQLEVSNEEVKKLQELVSEYRKKLKDGTYIVMEGETIFDTIYRDTSSILKIDIEDKWITAHASKIDSTVVFSLQIRNEYNIIVGEEKGKYLAVVQNLNPYSETKVMRVYQNMESKKKRFGIGPCIGFGVTYSKPYYGAFIGISVSYNLIQF